MFDPFIHKGLLGRKRLNNSYSGLRHAKARSNLARLLISDQDGYGLTEDGAQELIAVSQGQPAPDIIVCSELPRARESAAIRAAVFGGTPVVLCDARLNERRWGLWEGTAEENCAKIYEHDRLSMTTHPHSECVASLFGRASELIYDLDETHQGKRIELVSHADLLQVIALVFSPRPNITHYTDIPYLKNARGKALIFAQRKTAAEAAIDLLPGESRLWPVVREGMRTNPA